MTRTIALSLSIGILGLGGLTALGLLGGATIMPSYLAAWLVLVAAPLGALPAVMTLELLGLGDAALMPSLRRLVAVMPLAALLAAPVLLGSKGLYPLLGLSKVGFPGWWMSLPFFVARTIGAMMAWVALALVFAKPARSGSGRPALAGAGLAVHLFIGTLAAVDWAMAAEPAFTSSAFGPLLLVAQVGLAAALAVLFAEPDRRSSVERLGFCRLMAFFLCLWIFLEGSQYLVVWSANLPREVAWYQVRSAGFGILAQSAAGVVCVLALVTLLLKPMARQPVLLVVTAMALVVLHGLEMFWLVTPAFRASFSLTPADLLALAGAGGLGLGTMLLFGGKDIRSGGLRHGSA